MKKAHHADNTNIADFDFIIYDPVSFAGGSKVAMNHIIGECRGSRPIVATCDPSSWHAKHTIIPLYLPQKLKRASSGIPFYGKQLFLSVQLVVIFLKYIRIKKVAVISGPAVDIAALILGKLLKKYTIQLIQGPISHSRVALLGLKMSSRIFYLASCQKNIANLIQYQSTLDIAKINQKSTTFTNGLPHNQWPTPSLSINSDNRSINNTSTNNTSTNRPVIAHNNHHNPSTLPNPIPSRVFWAASLLKWKGLDILETAMNHYLNNTHIQASICYIQPNNTTLACHQAPQNNQQISVWENPNNLDEIRSQCNIFVSTSQHEPFGLSILEAMAARLCPVIPKDGAYWDTQLTHGVNCFKYTPNDPQSLARILLLLSRHTFCITSVGQCAQDIASQYKAQNTYRAIVQVLLGSALNDKPSAFNESTKGL